MQKEVLHGCHDIIMAGHLGQCKAIEKLKEAVIWHGMTQDCILYVKSCSTCNKNKTKQAKKQKRNWNNIILNFLWKESIWTFSNLFRSSKKEANNC